jgi:hypothetical protein
MNLKMQKQFSRTARWLVMLTLAANSFALAQSTNDSAATDFSSFQIIPQRNIFNPNRYPIRSGYRPQPRLSAGVPTFSLAGTMSYRKGMFAFFSGTSSDYEKAMQAGGTIAGFTVTKIDLDGAQLQTINGKAITMKVGAAMQQENNGWLLRSPGDWEAPSTTETEIENSSSPSTATPEAGTNSNPSPDLGGNDVLKRLMQQRQQELK